MEISLPKLWFEDGAIRPIPTHISFPIDREIYFTEFAEMRIKMKPAMQFIVLSLQMLLSFSWIYSHV